jgi:hypothetical protein
MDWEKVAYTILILFGFVGVTIVSTFFHEYNHYNDLKNLVVQDQFCVLNYEPSIDAGIGYFRFYYNDSISKDLPGIQTQSELKSYVISSAIIIVFVWALLYIYNERYLKYNRAVFSGGSRTPSLPEID